MTPPRKVLDWDKGTNQPPDPLEQQVLETLGNRRGGLSLMLIISDATGVTVQFSARSGIDAEEECRNLAAAAAMYAERKDHGL